MKKITEAQLKKILADHAEWRANPNTGSRANLSEADLFRANLSEADLSEANLFGANLRGANLSEADLRGANLSEADLFGANLSEADLSEADLFGANLSEADLSEANLFRANLSEANLSRADLRGANLCGAGLDFGQWPLWCGSLGVKIDERLARQLVYHALAVSKEWFKPTKKQLEWVNKFHRIPEVPKLK